MNERNGHFDQDPNHNNEGFVQSGTGTIYLNEDLINQFEHASTDDERAALFDVFITLTHETVHYGDYLDNSQSKRPEVGEEFVENVFYSNTVIIDGKKEKGNEGRFLRGEGLEGLKKMMSMEKKEGKSDVIPTLPSCEEINQIQIQIENGNTQTDCWGN